VNKNGELSTIGMKNQLFYQNDVFGLKTLNEQDRLVMHNVTNVPHNNWLTQKNLFYEYLLPHLY
jgi:hypothetical protein